MKKSSLALLSVLAAAPATAPQAQESTGGPQLEEVTVSARRRDENLMQVPLSISALGAATIQDIGLKDITEWSAFTPGMYASAGGNGRAHRRRHHRGCARERRVLQQLGVERDPPGPAGQAHGRRRSVPFFLRSSYGY